MAVFNSNLKRFLLVAVLLLSACTDLGSTAEELIESSTQDSAEAGDSNDQGSSAASASEGEEETLQQVQETPTLIPTNEPAQEVVQEESQPTATEEPTLEPTEESTVEPTPEPSPTAEPQPTEAPPPEPTPLPISITSSTADMLLIEGGEFEMGAEAGQLLEACNNFHESCDEGWFTASEPIHLVQLDPYYLDAYEVTNEAFLQFLNQLDDIDNGCKGEQCFEISDSRLEVDADGLYSVDEAFFEHPVTGTTWYGASAFCQWREARLPTEAEWEVAASWNPQDESKNFYSWGNEFDGSLLNHCDVNCEEDQSNPDFDDGFAMTAPVGSYEDGRSPSGNYDMSGNVWEWANDWFSEDYYANTSPANPQGPEDGDAKVVRGGSWIDTGNFSATSVRFPAPPQESGNSIGFRCALDAVPEDEVLAMAPEEESSEEDLAETDEEEQQEATSEEETAEEAVVDEVVEETDEEAVEEETAEEEVAEEATSEEAEDEVTEADASDAPISVNCDLQPGIDNGSTYVVGACDWLEKIANRLGVTYHALLAANPQISDPNLIYPGQVLNVPTRNDVSGAARPGSNSSGEQVPPFLGGQPPGGGSGN